MAHSPRHCHQWHLRRHILVPVQEMSQVSALLQQLRLDVKGQPDQIRLLQKTVPNGILQRLQAPPEDVSGSPELSPLVQGYFLEHLLADPPAEVLNDVQDLAGRLGTVPAILRPGFENLQANLPEFSKSVKDVDDLICPLWEPQVLSARGTDWRWLPGRGMGVPGVEGSAGLHA